MGALPLSGGTLTGNLSLPNHGIHLGGSGSANLLDYYERGSFTPTILSSAGADPVVSYNIRIGRYTLNGNICVFYCHFRVASITSQGASNFVLGHLPFIAENTSHLSGNVSINYAHGWASTNAPQTGYIAANDDKIRFIKNDSSDARSGLSSGPTCNTLQAGQTLILSGHYCVSR